QFAVRVLKTGASGYMTKESAPEELVGAIKKVLNGGRYVSPVLAEKMASYTLPSTHPSRRTNGSPTASSWLNIRPSRSVSIICSTINWKMPRDVWFTGARAANRLCGIDTH